MLHEQSFRDVSVSLFPADKQDHVRNMLSTSLRGVVSQQLLKKKDGTGRVAALEILVNTSAVANLIRQGKLEQLENVLQSSAREGMCTMDTSLRRLLDQGTISGQEAYMQAFDKSKFEQVKDIA
jgi:twitching motility protein PilT